MLVALACFFAPLVCQMGAVQLPLQRHVPRSSPTAHVVDIGETEILDYRSGDTLGEAVDSFSDLSKGLIDGKRLSGELNMTIFLKHAPADKAEASYREVLERRFRHGQEAWLYQYYKNLTATVAEALNVSNLTAQKKAVDMLKEVLASTATTTTTTTKATTTTVPTTSKAKFVYTGATLPPIAALPTLPPTKPPHVYPDVESPWAHGHGNETAGGPLSNRTSEGESGNGTNVTGITPINGTGGPVNNTAGDLEKPIIDALDRLQQSVNGVAARAVL